MSQGYCAISSIFILKINQVYGNSLLYFRPRNHYKNSGKIQNPLYEVLFRFIEYESIEELVSSYAFFMLAKRILHSL